MFQAQCTCGWHSQPYASESLPLEVGKTHVIVAQVAEQQLEGSAHRVWVQMMFPTEPERL